MLPDGNHAYQSSLRPALGLAGDVSTVWQQVLARPEAFVHIDPTVFCDPAITSAEYCARYQADLAYDEASLLRLLNITEALEVEDALATECDFDGHVVVFDGGIELIADNTGTALEYPFPLADLLDVAVELSADDDR